MKKIAFFVGRFPILSETFVIRQIVGAIESGLDVTVVSGARGDILCGHPDIEKYKLLNKVVFVRPESGVLRVLFNILSILLFSFVSGKARMRLKVALNAFFRGPRASVFDLFSSADPNFFLGRFDLIVAHFGPAGVRAMDLRSAGVLEGRIATVFHGFDISNHDLLSRMDRSYSELFQKTELFLPISQLWADRLIRLGASKDSVRVLHMGVDVDLLGFQASDRKLNVPLRVLSVARLTEKKGIEYAIRGVLGCDSEIDYRIVGDGPLSDSLRSIVENSDFPGRVSFLGRLNQSDVFQLLSWADVFLLPSVVASDGDMEGIPVSLMEAMAKGVLVLATRHSANGELIEDRVSGFLVDERNSQQISDALIEISSLDISRVSSFRIAARNKIEVEFDGRDMDLKLKDIVLRA